MISAEGMPNERPSLNASATNLGKRWVPFYENFILFFYILIKVHAKHINWITFTDMFTGLKNNTSLHSRSPFRNQRETLQFEECYNVEKYVQVHQKNTSLHPESFF